MRLLNEKLDVEEEIVQIRGQISTAVANQKKTGEYADPDWFARAHAALRCKGREAQEIQLELSDVGAAIKARARSRAGVAWSDKAFIRVARRRLDPALFDELMREATEEKA